ncbi:hypothetical protein ACJ3XI_08155 [Litorimonas sp. RW-G-Af-16]|uniref:hypothetical protein n=1 Tax=Litorimonas sp. RW-G-Af-16 TaxID=3241168 RepID=UPI00390C9BC8
MSGTRMWILPIAIIALGTSGASPFAASQNLAEAAATQVEDDLTPARDLPTAREDLTLTNQCIDDGKDKTECLCVTTVLKYELSLREYRVASQIYTAKPNTNQSAIKMTLAQQGYTDEEISRLSRFTSNLTSESDFSARCSEAQTYFKAENLK